jgi:leader peptidase (prepilin peptidase)/N-methyltransferase
MIIQLAIFFTLVGLAIGSFLNVCIDRLPPKRLLYMVDDKGKRLDIEIPFQIFSEDPVDLFKGKNVYVTGKIYKNIYTGNLQIDVVDASQIIIQEEAVEKEDAIPWTEAESKVGTIIKISGYITDGKTVHHSIIRPTSHCDSCQHKLGILDNIPIFSYIFLRGRCRYCKAKIPLRVLLVELVTGAIFLVAFWRFGLSLQFLVTVFWSSIFIVIIFIDWEHKLILNRVTYPSVIIAVALLAVDSFVPGVNLFGDRTFIPQTSLYSGLISGAVLFIFFILIVIIRPGAMGMGDAKLVTLIGLVSGFPFMISSMLIGVIIGGVVAIILLATKKKSRKDVIPYGTFLAMGPIIAMLADPYLMNWYLNMGK